MSDQGIGPTPSAHRSEYLAFISYKREDAWWARWLHRRLEAYRIPSPLRKHSPHLPKRVRPIFWDQTDIPAGPLLPTLRRELGISRHLIVICSPAAAKSAWVNKEVQHFVDLGRGDRVIPFVIAGRPNASDPERECFPPALPKGEQQLLGVSVAELGREKAFIKVVARLLDLPFDVVWDRHRRRRRQRLLWGSLTAAVLLMTATVASLLYWDAYYRPHTDYYANFSKRWGNWEGVGPLNLQQAAHRSYNLKFTRRGSRGPVERIQIVGADGKFVQGVGFGALYGIKTPRIFGRTLEVQGTLQECEVVLKYLDGNVREEKYFDARGQLLYEFQHTGPDTGCYVYKGIPHAATSDPSAVEVFTRPEQGPDAGRDTELRFRAPNGQPGLSPHGVSCEQRSFDARGLATEVRCLDPQRGMATCIDGYAKLVFNYDAMGNITSWACFDSRERPSRHRAGYHACQIQYDEWGNWVEMAWFDEAGNAVSHAEGYHKYTAAYDDQGRIEELAVFGPNGEPARSTYGYHKGKVTYLDQDGSFEIAYAREDGQPATGLYIAPYVQVLVDEHGWPTGVQGFDTNHKRIPFPALSPTAEMEPPGPQPEEDDASKQGPAPSAPELSTAGPEKEPPPQPAPEKPKDHALDELKRAGIPPDIATGLLRGMLSKPLSISAAFLTPFSPKDVWPPDIRIEPIQGGTVLHLAWSKGTCRSHDDGIRTTTIRLDLDMNVTESVMVCADLERESVCKGPGTNLIQRKNDPNGNVIEEIYLDSQEKPAQHTRGYHGWTAKHDPRGNRIEQTYLDAQRRPVACREGYAIIRRKFEGTDHETEWACFAADGAAVLDGSDGTHKILSRHDAAGNLIEQSCHGIDGNPVCCKEGYHRTTMKHDAAGTVVAKAHYDIAGARLIPWIQVVKVLPGKQGEAKGVRVNDIVLRYAGKQFTVVSEFIDAVQVPGDSQRELVVRRNGQEAVIRVAPGPLGIVLQQCYVKPQADEGGSSAPSDRPTQGK